MNKKLSLVLLALVLAPIFVSAAASGLAEPQAVNLDMAKIMGNVAKMVWYIFAGIAIIMFLVAGILFLTASGNPGKLDQAKQAVIWGIVGIVVGVSAGGIITFVQTQLM